MPPGKPIFFTEQQFKGHVELLLTSYCKFNVLKQPFFKFIFGLGNSNGWGGWYISGVSSEGSSFTPWMPQRFLVWLSLFTQCPICRTSPYSLYFSRHSDLWIITFLTLCVASKSQEKKASQGLCPESVEHRFYCVHVSMALTESFWQQVGSLNVASYLGIRKATLQKKIVLDIMFSSLEHRNLSHSALWL